MGDDLFRMTHTKISTFEQCRKHYWFSYLSGLPWPPETDSVATMTGKAVHRAMQVLCETGDESDARNHLDAFLRMPKHAPIAEGTPEYTTVMELFERGCEAHRSIVSEERWAELDTWVPSKARGIAVRTIVDRADRLSANEWQVIDWKTGRADKPESVDRQLDIAHLVVRTARRLPAEASVVAIGWNLRTGDRRVRLLNRGDAANTMHYLASLAQRMQAATEFEATPSPACGYCPWRPQCPEAVAVETAWDAWPDAAGAAPWEEVAEAGPVPDPDV